MNTLDEIYKDICPHGPETRKMMEKEHPGYCEQHCGKWINDGTWRGIHFLDYHCQSAGCARRFGITGFQLSNFVGQEAG